MERVDTINIEAVLATLVGSDAILYTDRTRGIFHIQNANTFDSSQKKWVPHFHDVPTKYLGDYIDCSRMLERYQAGITLEICIFESVGRISEK